MSKNNLFNYATSELSQDAFICYLASFAFEDASSDPVLNECARSLFHLFVPDIDSRDVVLENIDQQLSLEGIGRIDVLLTAQSNGKKYKIIVEDKTFTSEHDNQLLKYKSGVCAKFPDSEVYGVFYKTGFQSDLTTVEKAGYNIITREKMLFFLTPFAAKTNNQIIIDYYNYWKDLQDDAMLFSAKPVQTWNWKQTYGFYDYLQLGKFFQNDDYWKGYGYVANVAGGFYGFWFGKCRDDVIVIKKTKFGLYLQLETVPWGETTNLKICLKLSCEDNPKNDNVRKARNQILYEDEVNWAYRVKKYRFNKPKRVVGAKYMTIGIFDGEFTNLMELEKVLREAMDEYERLLGDLKNLG